MIFKSLSVLRLSSAIIAALLIQSCANAPIAGSSHLTTAEKMMWSTYAIATPKGLATCIIVNRRDQVAPHHTVPVLITAAHVLASAPRGPFYVVVRTPNGSETPSLEILEFAPSTGMTHPFFRHPLHDVAMIELNIPPDLADEATLPSFLNEGDIGRAADIPHTGDDVSVLGFPHVLPGTLGAFPVLRAGRVASRVQGPGADSERLLINTSAFAGDSGAPVIAGGRFGQPKLVGILSERIGKQEAVVPLAIALSASVVRETLQLQREQEHFEVQVGTPENISPPTQRKGGVQLLGPPQPLSKSAIQKLWSRVALP
jgi:trypsin-like peptidase